MNLQARKIVGGAHSSEDILEVVLDTNGEIVNGAIHTIEVVTGIAVTHGGGAPANSYLHYRSVEEHLDAEGHIDYSNIHIPVVQVSKGSSSIRVVSKVVLQEDVDTFTPLYATWKSQAHAAGVSEEHPNGLDGTFTVPSPTMPDPTILKTGEVLLEWVDDLFV